MAQRIDSATRKAVILIGGEACAEPDLSRAKLTEICHLQAFLEPGLAKVHGQGSVASADLPHLRAPTQVCALSSGSRNSRSVPIRGSARSWSSRPGTLTRDATRL